MVSKKAVALISVVFMLVGLCSCMTVDVREKGADGLNADSDVNDLLGADPFAQGGASQGGAAQGGSLGTDTGNSSDTDSGVSEQDSVKNPLTMTKEEQLEYFNTCINNVKSDFPGFKRAKLTTVSDIVLSNKAANAFVSVVKDALLSEEVEEKTAQKGSSNMELMSPDGERFVSQLTMSDISDITVTANGDNYIITVFIPDAVNPDKESGSYAKIFNFITVSDVENTYAPKVGATVAKKDIKVNYSGCYAKAMLSPDGKVLAYETYVTCVMSLKNAQISIISTDVDITLASTTRYTDFTY